MMPDVVYLSFVLFFGFFDAEHTLGSAEKMQHINFVGFWAASAHGSSRCDA